LDQKSGAKRNPWYCFMCKILSVERAVVEDGWLLKYGIIAKD
jgi:hypothetical protein